MAKIKQTAQPVDPTIQLAAELIAQKSLTPNDAGCQTIMIDRLRAVGFTVTRLRFKDVDNFWAIHGSDGPILALAGHTDVVPVGDDAKWRHAPFSPVIDDNKLYGRGAADMKGSLAAMVIASETFIKSHPNHSGRLAFLITSDEEGMAMNGTRKVVDWLASHNESIKWCLVGEPSSSQRVGDTIKNGRRGSLSGKLVVNGKQGHVAYPQLADNPIHALAPALAELLRETWDSGNDHFPPTSFQTSNLLSGTGASNVIPGLLTMDFNFRFSTELTPLILKSRTQVILDAHHLNYEIDWHLSGAPFITSKGALVDAVIASVFKVSGIHAQLSTAGGTSDGRFIAPTGAQVVELGPVNATIHQIDEHVECDDLIQLSRIYQSTIEKLLS